MNLAELSRLDIKDLQKLNYAQILADLQKKPEILLTIALVLGSIIFSVFYCHRQYQTMHSLRNQLAMTKRKVELINEYNKQKSTLAEYLNTLPKDISENELISKLTDMAIRRNIKIASFTPAGSLDDDLTKVTSLRFDISAEYFQQVWLFIRDIERSGYSLRIDNWTGRMEKVRRSNRNSVPDDSVTDDTVIRATVEIAAVKIKKE